MIRWIRCSTRRFSCDVNSFVQWRILRHCAFLYNFLAVCDSGGYKKIPAWVGMMAFFRAIMFFRCNFVFYHPDLRRNLFHFSGYKKSPFASAWGGGVIVEITMFTGFVECTDYY